MSGIKVNRHGLPVIKVCKRKQQQLRAELTRKQLGITDVKPFVPDHCGCGLCGLPVVVSEGDDRPLGMSGYGWYAQLTDLADRTAAHWFKVLGSVSVDTDDKNRRAV